MSRKALWIGLLVSLLGSAPLRAQFYGKDRFEVATAAQFLEAIGSDRTLVVAPTVLTLSDLTGKAHRHLRWNGQSATIVGVKNLRIIGAPDGESRRSQLVTRDDAFVLAFENCRNVEVRGLTFRHVRPDNQCTSAILAFVACTNTLLHACELTGCGTEGLTLSRVDRFQGRDLRISDCTAGIMSIQHSRNLIFLNSRFEGNGPVYGVDIRESYAIEFNDCVFAANRIDGDLLAASGSGKIIVRGGELTGNRFRRLRNNPTGIRLVDLKDGEQR